MQCACQAFTSQPDWCRPKHTIIQRQALVTQTKPDLMQSKWEPRSVQILIVSVSTFFSVYNGLVGGSETSQPLSPFPPGQPCFTPLRFLRLLVGLQRQLRPIASNRHLTEHRFHENMVDGTMAQTRKVRKRKSKIPGWAKMRSMQLKWKQVDCTQICLVKCELLCELRWKQSIPA